VPELAEDSSMMDEEEKEAMIQAQLTEKLSNVLDTYKAENEKMRKKLDTMRIQEEEVKRARSEEAQQIKDLLKDLATVKEMLGGKDRALVKHQLGATFYPNPVLIDNGKSATTLIKAGNIQMFETGKALKWVEIHFHSGSAYEKGPSKGHLMLTFADAKDSDLVNRCEILRLNEKSDVKTQTICVDVILSDKENELIYVCEDEKETTSWLEAISEGLRQIEDEKSAIKMANDDVSQRNGVTEEKLSSVDEEKLVETEGKGESKVTEEDICALEAVKNDITREELSLEKLDNCVVEKSTVLEGGADELKSVDNEQPASKQIQALDEEQAKDQESSNEKEAKEANLRTFEV